VAKPELAQDARLMAHEAAHLLQQRGGATLRVETASAGELEARSRARGDLEAEAEAVVSAFLGGPVSQELRLSATGEEVLYGESVESSESVKSPFSECKEILLLSEQPSAATVGSFEDVWEALSAIYPEVFAASDSTAKLDALRAVSPISGGFEAAGQSLSLPKMMRLAIAQMFLPEEELLWLAEQLVDYGPEPLWPAELLEQRRLKFEGQAPSKLGESGHVGTLMTSSQGLAVRAYYFEGSSSERALVLGGVHGTEQAGIQVCERLIEDLKQAPQKPYYSAIVVPMLFVDHGCKEQPSKGEPQYEREYGSGDSLVEPNRNLCQEGVGHRDEEGNVALPYQGIGKNGEEILPENVALLDLISRFKPSRVISVHTTAGAGSNGFFVDKRIPAADEKGNAQPARDHDYLDRINANPELKAALAEQDRADQELAVRMGRAVYDQRTQEIDQHPKLNEEQKRQQRKHTDALVSKTVPKADRDLGKRVDLDQLSEAELDKRTHFHTDGVMAEAGVSHGRYLSRPIESGPHARPALTIITCEVAHQETIQRSASGAQKRRESEVKAYADAIRTIFLGSSSGKQGDTTQ
jgi:hypothetical protein